MSDFMTKIVGIVTNEVTLWIGSVVVTFIVAPFIQEYIKDKYSSLKEKKANKNKEFEFTWVPQTPVVNLNSQDVKHIDTYPKDIFLDFNTGDISFDRMVEGMECFKMQLTKLIHTEKDKYEIYKGTSYGITFLFYDVANQEDFILYSQTNAQDILNKFDDYIKEIYYIKKYNNKKMLQIGLGLKGRNEIVKIDIPLKKFE